MKRWHKELAIMVKRNKLDASTHYNRTKGTYYECQCLTATGYFRKSRPLAKCSPNQGCSVCNLERKMRKAENRKIRRSLKRTSDRIEWNYNKRNW